MNSPERQPRQAVQPQDFEAAKARLEEIANTVDDESLSLDEALDLFEEAVGLGLKVSDFVEEGIAVEDDAGESGVGLDADIVAEAVPAETAVTEPIPDKAATADASVAKTAAID